MKEEKVRKHYRKNTVVVGEGWGADKTVGVFDHVGTIQHRARIDGYTPDHGNRDYNYFGFDNVRKATDGERADFFEWLRALDAEERADLFAAWGLPPRGWEE